MKKIDRLVLKNFKAFRDQTFEFGSKNVLIYGNNGSGKSSLYWALYTFLQSSGKTNAQLQAYFQHFDPTNPDTFRSLKNVFASQTDDVLVEMTYMEDDGTKTTKSISPTILNTNVNVPEIKKANLASDFINYKLLQNFYNVTHKQEVNLWEVFWRDVFPYFEENGKGYREQMEELSLPIRKTQAAKQQFQDNLDTLNNQVETFIGTIQDNANLFLKEHFFDGKDVLEVCLQYWTKIDENWVKTKDEALSENRIPPNAEIRLWVKVYDTERLTWIENHRPQSFLNEAQLTRIALAIRIGALLTRTQTTDFKILCLDDLLVSMDMSNRRKVLEWLLNHNDRYTNKYQIFLFTHDKSFQEVIKYYIEKLDNTENWKYFEMFFDEYHDIRQPYVIDNSSDNLSKARYYFNEYDFPACANSLRTECERVIILFLPDNLLYTVSKEGECKLKPLEKLIDELKQLFKAFGKEFMPLNDLYLYKDLLLNPLSHDNLGTTVYQDELHSLINKTIPELQKLKSENVIELNSNKPTFVFLTETDLNGVTWKYQILLLEHWRKYLFLDGSIAYSAPKCQVISRSDGSNPVENFGNEGKCKNINDAYRKISHELKCSSIQGKQVFDLISIT